MRKLPVDIADESLAEFCARWRVQELALFGSALGPDFGPGSDLDLLVTFQPHASYSLFDHIRMAEELPQLAGRRVDLLTRRSVERSPNPIRRESILSSAETIHAAR